MTPSSSSETARISVQLIALGAFALGMASYATAGLMPLIAQALDVSQAATGQLVTAFTLAYGLASPVVVALLPRHYQRAGLLGALLLFALANAASALAPSFPLLMAWRALAGVGAGVYLALGIAACAALGSKMGQGKSIALVMGGMASGTVLGVPLSLELAGLWGWAVAFWLITTLGAIAFVGLLLKLPALPIPASVPLAHKMALLKHPATLSILSVSLLAAVASLGMYTFIAPFMFDIEPMVSITLYLWVWGLGGIAGSVLIGPLADRYRDASIALTIMALLAISLAVLPFMASLHPWLALVPIALWGSAGWALQVPQNSALLDTRRAQGDGHLAVALNESALYLGSALGAILGGLWLSLEASPSVLPLLAAAIALAGVLLQWHIRRQH
ncbi:MFS transporter [Halomonas dongshanensis]|uniref:MFS transporter n=1 Tax=Halomonas dongshanensis TaxID=2890835 RepID=A0ABT2EAF5_9GAMM|nr:MFS transporter [Halomonas dongshanensis]MCS2608562.1 MFS transporter [Halomonas dongshanensis]